MSVVFIFQCSHFSNIYEGCGPFLSPQKVLGGWTRVRWVFANPEALTGSGILGISQPGMRADLDVQKPQAHVPGPMARISELHVEEPQVRLLHMGRPKIRSWAALAFQLLTATVYLQGRCVVSLTLRPGALWLLSCGTVGSPQTHWHHWMVGTNGQFSPFLPGR